jgi:hypothetical protein
VLYTPTSFAQWHAGLTAGVGGVSEGRALICLAPLVKTHAPFTSFGLGVDQNRLNRLVLGILMSECHYWNCLARSHIDRCVKLDGAWGCGV